MGSRDSSPDDCSSLRDQGEHCYHVSFGGCCSCALRLHPAPAEGETAGEPEAPQCDGCGHAPHVADQCSGYSLGERCACDEPLAPPQPEAPEPSRAMCTCGYDPAKGGGHAPSCFASQPPPRPPYALTYVTGSGARIQIALPGEATTAVYDGALIITHPSGILGIEKVGPWSGNEAD